MCFPDEAVATSGGPAFSQGDKLIVMVTWWGIPKRLLNVKTLQIGCDMRILGCAHHLG